MPIYLNLVRLQLNFYRDVIQNLMVYSSLNQQGTLSTLDSFSLK